MEERFISDYTHVHKQYKIKNIFLHIGEHLYTVSICDLYIYGSVVFGPIRILADFSVYIWFMGNFLVLPAVVYISFYLQSFKHTWNFACHCII